MGDSSVATVNRALAQLNVNRDAKRLVVAIDFGTTYSGIAYCFPDLPPDGKLTAIRKWPGTHVQAAKVPTIVKYDKNDWGKYEWGTLLKSAEDHIVGIKLLLDPSQKLPWHVPPTDLNATMKLLPPFKTPKNVATDFMRSLKAHGMSQIATNLAQDALDLFQVEYVMSGDVIVICDAGGGTLIGDTVGSIALNRRFKAVLEALIPSDRWQKFKDSRAMVKASQQFENEIKLEFSGDLNEEFYVDLPGADLDDIPEKGLLGNEWKMTGRDVKSIFDPVIADILHLIQHQVQAVQREGKAVRAIFLVGGFGSSEYLRKEVERVHEGIKVAQPDDAWAAIAKSKSRNVKVNCVLYADVSKVPLSKFSKRTRKHSQALVSKRAGFPSETDDHGETYWEVTYDLVICFDSAVMKFSMELDGETLGSVEARFEQ
ncbi:hypothetical protein MY5147_009661 [Beauveria neobassiana]